MLYGKLKFPSRVLAAIVLSALSMGLQTVNAAPKKKAAPKVKVACVGNSITYGTGIQDRENFSYPVPRAMPWARSFWAFSPYLNHLRKSLMTLMTNDLNDHPPPMLAGMHRCQVPAGG